MSKWKKDIYGRGYALASCVSCAKLSGLCELLSSCNGTWVVIQSHYCDTLALGWGKKAKIWPPRYVQKENIKKTNQTSQLMPSQENYVYIWQLCPGSFQIWNWAGMKKCKQRWRTPPYLLMSLNHSCDAIFSQSASLVLIPIFFPIGFTLKVIATVTSVTFVRPSAGSKNEFMICILEFCVFFSCLTLLLIYRLKTILLKMECWCWHW